MLLVAQEGRPRDRLASALRGWALHVVVAADGQVAAGYLDAMPLPCLLILTEPLGRLDALSLLRQVAARPDAGEFQALLLAERLPEGLQVGRGRLRALIPSTAELDQLEAGILAWKEEVTRARLPAP